MNEEERKVEFNQNVKMVRDGNVDAQLYLANCYYLGEGV